MLRMISGISAAVVLAASLSSGASAATMNAQDRTFVTKAAQGGMAEVKLAALAMEKSTDPAVRSFAHHMTSDHTKANAQLAAILRAQGVTPPMGVGPMNAMLMTRLQAQRGSAFNAAYLTSQLPAHRTMLALFKAEAANGSDPALVNFAKQTIPTIESHIVYDKTDISKLDSREMSMSSSARK